MGFLCAEEECMRKRLITKSLLFNLRQITFQLKLKARDVLSSLKRWKEAAEVYNDLVETAPQQQRTYLFNRLGICLDKMNDIEHLRDIINRTSYQDSISTTYSLLSTVRWCLRTGIKLNSELAPKFRALSSGADAENITDALVIYLTHAMGSENFSEKNFQCYKSLVAASSYGKDAIFIFEKYRHHDAVKIVDSLNISDGETCIDDICAHIEHQKPLSLIRLGDGEGNLLAMGTHSDNRFLNKQAQKILRIWFGQFAKPVEFYQPLLSSFQDALRRADVVGFPNASRLQYELTNDCRGYWGVYFAVYFSHLVSPQARRVSATVHFDLFRSERFIAALTASTTINTISCHRDFGPMLRARLWGRERC